MRWKYNAEYMIESSNDNNNVFIESVIQIALYEIFNSF